MKIKRNILLVLFVFSLPFAFSKTENNASKTVRVGYFYADEYQEGDDYTIKHGAGYDFLQKIASYADWEYKYVYGSFNDLLEMLVKGEIDILNNVSYTEERSKLISYSNYAQAQETTGIYCSPENSQLYTDDVHSLDGKTIGILTGSIQIKIFNEWLSTNGINCSIISIPTYNELLDSLENGKSDVIVHTDLSPNTYLSQLFTLDKHTVYIAASKHSPDILEDLNNALSRIREIEPGYYADLFGMYASFNYSKSKRISSEAKEYIKQHKVIRIGCMDDDMPFYERYEKKLDLGFIPEVIKMIFQKLDINDVTFEFRTYNTFEQRQNALLTGEVDVLAPIPSIPAYAEAKEFLVSNPVVSNPMGIIYRKKIPFENLKKIGIANGMTAEYYIRLNYPEYEPVIFNSRNDMDFAFTNKFIDGIVTNIYKASSNMKNNQSVTLKELDAANKVSFAVKRTNTALLEIINRGLTNISQEEINRSFTKYASKEISYSSSDFLFDYSFLIIFVLIALVLISVVAVYNWQKSLYIQKKLQAAIENTKEQQRLLEIAKKKAEASSVAKTTFLFNMSHDIRTPMNAILGYTNMARKYADDIYKVNDCMKKIDYSGQHLLRLINELLDMARIESGKITQKIIPCNLSVIAKQTKDMIQHDIEEKGLKFEYEEKELANRFVYADELHVSQVLINILNNAIKYTDSGGTIKFTVQQNSTFLTKDGLISYSFIVTDTGTGMSKQFLEHIFEPFSREKTSTVSGKVGTGLGMSIVKHLMELMNGHINVTSELGNGTQVSCTFYFKLCDESEYIKETTPVIKEKVDYKGKRILLVEDNQLNREIAKDILEEAGFTVDEADDGTTCLEKYRSVPDDYYYFILMDIQMPKMDGYTATLNIRTMENKKKASIPIIAITANAFEEDKHKSAEAGMNAHIAKPINPDVLIETISRFCY